MLTISKPLAATQAQTYHKTEFASPEQSYWAKEADVGQWQDQLAEEFGLSGAVTEEQFARLSRGQHPVTGEQMVRHRAAAEYTKADGTTVKTVEHRTGWYATFSAPKSVSLVALVGGDDRVPAPTRTWSIPASPTKLSPGPRRMRRSLRMMPQRSAKAELGCQQELCRSLYKRAER